MANILINWHKFLQDLFDDYLEIMSGKRIVEKAREVPHYFKVDYYCRVGPGKPKGRAGRVKGILIFDHLLTHNLFEYKSIHEILDERTLQEYAARGLFFLARKEKKSLKGRITLNILLTRVPKKLFKMEGYDFEELTPWKYRMYCMGLPIYIIIQKRMRKVEGGEPMAYYQVLEGDPNYQKQTWEYITNQDLTGAEDLKKIMMKLNREAFMTITELIINEARPEIINEARPEIINEARPEIINEARPEIINEARPEIIREGMVGSLLKGLRQIAPQLLPKYETLLKTVTSLAALQELETEIWDDIANQKG